jgi:hypothetical protein
VATKYWSRRSLSWVTLAVSMLALLALALSAGANYIE